MRIMITILMIIIHTRCQLEGVDEEGLKEREVELEQRRIRKKERDDMYRCQLIVKICCQIIFT